jgi:hypothetical protein
MGERIDDLGLEPPSVAWQCGSGSGWPAEGPANRIALTGERDREPDTSAAPNKADHATDAEPCNPTTQTT